MAEIYHRHEEWLSKLWTEILFHWCRVRHQPWVVLCSTALLCLNTWKTLKHLNIFERTQGNGKMSTSKIYNCPNDCLHGKNMIMPIITQSSAINSISSSAVWQFRTEVSKFPKKFFCRKKFRLVLRSDSVQPDGMHLAKDVKDSNP